MAATLKDLAKATGLSLATLSKYINGGRVLEKNKIAIEAAIDELGYHVNTTARSLKTRRSMTVGVLIPDLENVFSTRIVSCLENKLLQAGYSTLVCDYRSDEKLERERFGFLVERQIDGLLLMPTKTQAEDLKLLKARQIPVVLIDRPILDSDCDAVLINNREAAYDAVTRLIENGHRRIAIISGPKGIYTADERLQGYHDAIKAAGIPEDERLIREGRYDVASGYQMMQDLMKEPVCPTAVFITNHEMTFGAILALQSLGIIIPEQLSVIGFDNQELSSILTPHLSIVLQPLRQIGEKAAHLLLSRMDGKSGPAITYQLPASWLPGASVAPPPEK